MPIRSWFERTTVRSFFLAKYFGRGLYSTIGCMAEATITLRHRPARRSEPFPFVARPQ